MLRATCELRPAEVVGVLGPFGGRVVRADRGTVVVDLPEEAVETL